jgi:hypothetical protein
VLKLFFCERANQRYNDVFNPLRERPSN